MYAFPVWFCDSYFQDYYLVPGQQGKKLQKDENVQKLILQVHYCKYEEVEGLFEEGWFISASLFGKVVCTHFLDLASGI